MVRRWKASAFSALVTGGLTEPQAASLAAIEAKTNLIGAGEVTFTPTVTTAGPTITLVIGDAYGESAGHDAIVLIDSTDQWPSNVGDGTIMFSVRRGSGDVAISVEATLTTVDGHKAASVALTSAETAVLSYTRGHKYDLRAHWDDGSNMLLMTPGPCEVVRAVTPTQTAQQG